MRTPLNRPLLLAALFTLLAPAAAWAQAQVGVRLDHAAPRDANESTTGPSTTILLLRGGWDFKNFSAYAEVPLGFYSVPDEQQTGADDAFGGGNITFEFGRRSKLARRVSLDTRLKIYLPTLPASEEPGVTALTGTAAMIRPEEAPMWFSETLTVAPRMDLGLDLLYWLELSTMMTLYQALNDDSNATYLHINPRLIIKVAKEGRLGLGYGLFDRLDAEQDAQAWISVNGGFDSGSISAGLEVRLRQSPDEYEQAFGTQFGLYLGTRF